MLYVEQQHEDSLNPHTSGKSIGDLDCISLLIKLRTYRTGRTRCVDLRTGYIDSLGRHILVWHPLDGVKLFNRLTIPKKFQTIPMFLE